VERGKTGPSGTGISDALTGIIQRPLAASQLIGLAMLRYVVKVEPLASAVPADLASWLGPTLQRYFTDPAVTAADDGQTELR
jgi:Tetracyclin repressor-like, C-terminal domain